MVPKHVPEPALKVNDMVPSGVAEAVWFVENQSSLSVLPLELTTEAAFVQVKPDCVIVEIVGAVVLPTPVKEIASMSVVVETIGRGFKFDARVAATQVVLLCMTLWFGVTAVLIVGFK
jgi:hypothetical protein